MPTDNPQTLNTPPPNTTGPWPWSVKALADRLVTGGHVSAEVMAGAIATAAPAGRSLVEVLLEQRALDETPLRDAIAAVFELQTTDLGANAVQPDAVLAVTPAFARQAFLLPMELWGDRIVIAVADPTRSRDIRQLQTALNRTAEMRLATPSALGAALKAIYAPRVTIRLGDGPKATLILPPGDTQIGRSPSNAIVVPDPAVSTSHALIRENAAGYQIVDLGSRNGTYVNDERVVGSRQLENKDEIVIANARIKYRTVTPPEFVVPPDPEKAEAKRKLEVKTELIKSSGRILSQIVGAGALLFLGLAISGMLPRSCGKTESADTTDQRSASVASPAR